MIRVGADEHGMAGREQQVAPRQIGPEGAGADANRLLAKFECAQKAWQACLDAATDSANVVPYPETLGYEVDALHALGRTSEVQLFRDCNKMSEMTQLHQQISWLRSRLNTAGVGCAPFAPRCK